MANVTEKRNFFDLAQEEKLDPRTVWDSQQLKGLKAKRKHPCFLQVSDTFAWPELEAAPGRMAETNNKHQTFLRPTPRVIDVYLGFMDEEVNARLKEVLDREVKKPEKERRPVMLIERGRIGPQDFILEWPIGNYPKEAQTLKISQVSTDGKITRLKGDQSKESSLTEEGASTAPDDVLARALAVTMEQDVNSEVQLLFGKIPYKRYIDLLWLLQKRRGARSKVMLPGKHDDRGIWLSIVRFCIGDDRQAPVIVIRTPEMGLQPTLMAPYVAYLFKVISMVADQLADAQVERWHKIANPLHEKKPDTMTRTFAWPIRVCQFGAQGSTSENKAYLPGKMHPCIASLFVGLEIASDVVVKGRDATATFQATDDRVDEFDLRWTTLSASGAPPRDAFEKWQTEKGKLKVYAVVSLCTPARVYDFLREEIKIGEAGKDPVTTAEERAKTFFYECGAKPPAMTTAKKWPVKSESPVADEEDKVADKGTMKDFIAAITNDSEKLYGRKGAVTLTVSYFGGDEDKQAANKLGIVSVGMEDYHILRVPRTAVATGLGLDSDYPLIQGWRIDRITCDPIEIPKEIIGEFNKRIKSQRLTKQDYTDIILWGLQGVLGPLAPTCVKWGFPKKIEAVLKSPLQVSDLLYRYQPPQGAPFTPDPLCVEIATDFAKEAGAEAKDKDGAVLVAAVPALKEKGDAVMRLWKQKRDPRDKELLEKIGELLDQAMIGYEFSIGGEFYATGNGSVDFRGSDGVIERQELSEAITRVSANLFKCEVRTSDKFPWKPLVAGSMDLEGGRKIRVWTPKEHKIKTWLRPGKWSTRIKSLAVQDLEKNGESFDGAAVDRAFYKSCNLMALQTLAGTGLL